MSQSENKSPVLVDYATANAGMLSTLAHKKIRKFARQGWNGASMHVQVHGSIPTSQVDLGNGETAYLEPFFVIVNKAKGTVNTWVPSVSDLQAKDWYLVE